MVCEYRIGVKCRAWLEDLSLGVGVRGGILDRNTDVRRKGTEVGISREELSLTERVEVSIGEERSVSISSMPRE